MKKYLIIAIIIFMGYNHSYANKQYKYYEIESTNNIQKIIYSDKKALNNMVVKIKDGNGSINILCVPFSLSEYQKSINSLNKYEEKDMKNATIILKMSGISFKGEKLMKKNYCSIKANHYQNGLALFITYLGDCDSIKIFRNILSKINLQITSNNLKNNRKQFLEIMNTIKAIEIPIYNNPINTVKDYSISKLSKIVRYETEIKTLSEVYNFYNEYFQSINFNRYKDKYGGKWYKNRLFEKWIDEKEEIIARLIISSTESFRKDEKIFEQSINIDLIPYVIMEW